MKRLKSLMLLALALLPCVSASARNAGVFIYKSAAVSGLPVGGTTVLPMAANLDELGRQAHLRQRLGAAEVEIVTSPIVKAEPQPRQVKLVNIGTFSISSIDTDSGAALVTLTHLTLGGQDYGEFRMIGQRGESTGWLLGAKGVTFMVVITLF